MKTVYPEYYEPYLKSAVTQYQEKAQKINEVASFVFLTDLHTHANDMVSPLLIREIGKHTGIKNVFVGGDFACAFGTKEDCLQDIKRTLTLLKVIKEDMNLYIAKGNHDGTIREDMTSPIGYTAPYETIQSMFMGTNSPGAIGPDGKTYYYVDDADAKIRYIVLDTNEIHENEQTYWGIKYGMCEEQTMWLANVALRLGASKEDWSVVVIGHVPCSEGMTSYQECLKDLGDILKAYKNKKICTYGDFSQEKGELIAYICGHNHRDRDIWSDNTLFVSTGSDAYYQDDSWERKSGDISGILFDIFIINKKQKTVETIRVGAGESRKFSYASAE